VRRHGGAEQRLAWLLCAPALIAMLVVTAYPMLYAVWLSLFRYDLRFPGERRFIGLGNYLSVLGSETWWQALGNTLLLTVGSVSLELLIRPI
jgi:multiple sugar transport system permease protein